MAITVIAAVSSREDNVTGTFTITHGFTLANDDVLVSLVVKSTADAITDPTGWTEEIQTGTTAGEDMATQISYKKITDAGGEASSYDWTEPGSARWAGTILQLRGVDTTTQVDVSAANSNGTTWNDSTDTCPSVTTVTDGALAIANVSLLHFTNTSVTGFNPPSGWDERSDNISGRIGESVATKTITPEGATGTQQFDSLGADSVDDEWHTNMVAFRPTVVGGVTLSERHFPRGNMRGEMRGVI